MVELKGFFRITLITEFQGRALETAIVVISADIGAGKPLSFDPWDLPSFNRVTGQSGDGAGTMMIPVMVTGKKQGFRLGLLKQAVDLRHHNVDSPQLLQIVTVSSASTLHIVVNITEILRVYKRPPRNRHHHQCGAP